MEKEMVPASMSTMTPTMSPVVYALAYSTNVGNPALWHVVRGEEMQRGGG